MNKTFSFFFGIFSFGGAKETYRIITSNAPDIAPQRTYLMIMALIITGALLSITNYFCRKGTKKY